MQRKLQKETPLILIVLLPFIYLAYIWNDLPAEVPVHWNLNGEVDRYSTKSELVLIPILLPMLIYIILLIAPSIDPKKKLKNMGNKFKSIKILLTLLMSVLALFLLYHAKNNGKASPYFILPFIGALYIILGNYFKTIKTNYFIGIRTPWTLENDVVWKETHKMAGVLWFIGGITILVGSMVLDFRPSLILGLVISIIIVIVPVLFSYVKFNDVTK